MPLIVLGNREPLRQSEGSHWEPSVGGLTTALLPVLEKRGGVWVAWAEEDADTKPRLSYPEDEPKLEVHRLDLSKDEVAGYLTEKPERERRVKPDGKAYSEKPRQAAA